MRCLANELGRHLTKPGQMTASESAGCWESVCCLSLPLVLIPTASLAAVGRSIAGSVLIADWPAQLAVTSLGRIADRWALGSARSLCASASLPTGSRVTFRLRRLPTVAAGSIRLRVGVRYFGVLASHGPCCGAGERALPCWAQRMGVPHVGELLVHTARWLPIANFVLAAEVILIGLVVVLTFEERWMRVGAAAAVAGLVPGIAMLAIQRSSVRMRYIALLIATVAVIYLGWSHLAGSFRRSLLASPGDSSHGRDGRGRDRLWPGHGPHRAPWRRLVPGGPPRGSDRGDRFDLRADLEPDHGVGQLCGRCGCACVGPGIDTGYCGDGGT